MFSLQLVLRRSVKISCRVMSLLAVLSLLMETGCTLSLANGFKAQNFPHMIHISGGTFWMGGSEKDGIIGLDVGVDTLPKHKVKLDSYYIDKFEVTVVEYREFARLTGRVEPAFWSEIPKKFIVEDDLPAFGVIWNDAHEYCLWAEKRLPTEAEWEYAARGPKGLIWPWGNKFEKGYANLATPKNDNWIMPVGSKPKDVSPFGVFDMGGNVMEWTNSWYDKYPGSNLHRRAFGVQKTLRGGSWTAMWWMSKTIHRISAMAVADNPTFGFRCAAD